jgi:GntR family transcriptional regulator/MocR family aminotransferase
VRNAKLQFRGQFAVDRSRPEPLVDQVIRLLREAIDTGRLAHGTRLPSTRALAKRLGVSRNTVLAAYEALVSFAFIRGKSRHQVGGVDAPWPLLARPAVRSRR